MYCIHITYILHLICTVLEKLDYSERISHRVSLARDPPFGVHEREPVLEAVDGDLGVPLLEQEAVVPEEAARELRARRHRRVERRRPVLRGRPSLRQLCARHARLAVPVAHAAEQVAQRLRREAHLHGSWQQTVTFPIHVYTIKIAISLKMYFNLLIDIRVLSILDYAN